MATGKANTNITTDKSLIIESSRINEPLISIVVECFNTKNRVD